jgi:hypothetical protein
LLELDALLLVDLDVPALRAMMVSRMGTLDSHGYMFMQ